MISTRSNLVHVLSGHSKNCTESCRFIPKRSLLLFLALPLLAGATAQAVPMPGSATSTTRVRAYLVQTHHSVRKLLQFMDTTHFPQKQLYGNFHPIELYSPRTTYLQWTVRIPMKVSADSAGHLELLQPETQSPPSPPSSPPSTSSPSAGETVTITQNQTYNGQEWTTTATWRYQSSSSSFGGGSWELVDWRAVLDNVPAAPHHGGTEKQ